MLQIGLGVISFKIMYDLAKEHDQPTTEFLEQHDDSNSKDYLDNLTHDESTML